MKNIQIVCVLQKRLSSFILLLRHNQLGKFTNEFVFTKLSKHTSGLKIRNKTTIHASQHIGRERDNFPIIFDHDRSSTFHKESNSKNNQSQNTVQDKNTYREAIQNLKQQQYQEKSHQSKMNLHQLMHFADVVEALHVNAIRHIHENCWHRKKQEIGISQQFWKKRCKHDCNEAKNDADNQKSQESKSFDFAFRWEKIVNRVHGSLPSKLEWKWLKDDICFYKLSSICFVMMYEYILRSFVCFIKLVLIGCLYLKILLNRISWSIMLSIHFKI